MFFAGRNDPTANKATPAKEATTCGGVAEAFREYTLPLVRTQYLIDDQWKTDPFGRQWRAAVKRSGSPVKDCQTETAKPVCPIGPNV